MALNYYSFPFFLISLIAFCGRFKLPKNVTCNYKFLKRKLSAISLL